MMSSEPLHHFLDDCLSTLHELNPTAATFDGVHAYDDHLEDMSRGGIDAHIQTVAALSRRLAAIDDDSLTSAEKLERPWVAEHLKGRLHDLEQIRSWERNPQVYGELFGASLAAQALFDYAPAEQRARRILSKLRQAPRFFQAAEDNVKEAPGIFVKTSLETLRGVLRFVEVDLPKALADIDDLGLLGDLADAQVEAIDAIKAYLTYVENDLGPRAKASFRLGADKLAAKLKFEDGIDLPLDRLLDIGLRELGLTQEEFRKAAAKVEPGDPVEVWRRIKDRHLATDGVVTTARQQLEELEQFLRRRDLVTLPAGEPVVVAPTPDFYRWTFASMWTPGPFETKPSRAYYYLTEPDPSWPADRRQDHLRDVNVPLLWSISMHEVYPGHFLHFQRLRAVESKVRKSLVMASPATVEGWAHYCEQMMIESGFGKQDPTVRLGQLAESLIRICRLIVSIRLHAEDMSVEQGVRFFKDEAFLEEGSARREAERGTFDPSYIVYTAGKLMLLKLREDFKAEQGAGFSLKTFHDALLRNGLPPLPVHRRLMLRDTRGAAIG